MSWMFICCVLFFSVLPEVQYKHAVLEMFLMWEWKDSALLEGDSKSK